MTLRLEEGFPHELPEWSRMAEASGNVFATPEWLLTWYDHFGGEGPIVTASEYGTEGPLQALAIVQTSPPRRPLRVARFVGGGPSDELGPICRPPRRASTLGELRTALAEAGLADLLLAEQLPGGLDCRARSKGACSTARPAPSSSSPRPTGSRSWQGDRPTSGSRSAASSGGCSKTPP